MKRRVTNMTQNANVLAHKAKTRSYLNVMQALLWVIFFLPFYLLGGLQLLIPSGTVPDGLNVFLFPVWFAVVYISLFFFTKAIVYVLISLIVVTSGLAALVWGRKGRLAQIFALLGTLSVIGLPWFLPYEPALNAAPGVTMQVLTMPTNPLSSFVKMAYFFSEDVPCEYDLLGWSAENQLYYHSECEGEEQIWLVDPDQPDKATPTTDLPNDLTQKASQKETGRRSKEQEALRQEVLEMVRAERVRPERAERSVRETYLREGSLRSPDGQWIAAITRYVYAPQDVLLIRAQ